MSVAMMVAGGLQILGGFASHRQASVRAKWANKSNEYKTQYNLRQLEKVYKDNYAKNMTAYADARVQLDNQYRQSKSEVISMAQKQEMNGIDSALSSTYDTAKSILNDEFNVQLNRMIADSANQGSNLFKDLVRNQLNVQMQGIENKYTIAHQKLQSQQQAMQQMLQGAINMGAGYFGMKGGAAAADNAQGSLINIPKLTEAWKSVSNAHGMYTGLSGSQLPTGYGFPAPTVNSLSQKLVSGQYR